MAHDPSTRATCFGYLSTLHTLEHGYFGGYLLITATGRPLEFHCTSPVKPSRAQEILYGPTLAAYLLGEEIGGALVQAAKLMPRVILVDQPELLEVRQRAGMPAVLVIARDSSDPFGASMGVALSAPAPASQFAINGHSLQLASGFECDREAVSDAIGVLIQQVELAEPFGRIHEAIREAQRLGGGTAEVYGHAA